MRVVIVAKRRSVCPAGIACKFGRPEKSAIGCFEGAPHWSKFYQYFTFNFIKSSKTPKKKNMQKLLFLLFSPKHLITNSTIHINKENNG